MSYPPAATWVWLPWALALSCTAHQAPVPARESPPVSTKAAPATPPEAAPPREAAPSPLPTLGPEVFAPAGSHPQAIYRVLGALVIVDDRKRVGRVLGEGIEWLDKKLAPANTSVPDITITAVHGRWPDRLDVLYTANPARMSEYAYFPFTGKGRPVVRDSLGSAGRGFIHGIASVGESTVVSVSDLELRASVETVRGPALVRKSITPARAGCEEKDPSASSGLTAVFPFALAASEAGTLIAVGQLCGKSAAAAEVWDGNGASRILDLGAWVKGDGSGAVLLPGSGDEIFLFANAESPILAYRAGAFAPLPHLDKPVRNVFVSATGQLYASDGWTIHRFEEGRWIPIARLAWPQRFDAMAIEGETLWASHRDTVYRLQPAPSAEYRDGCPTPFVYLYDSSPRNGDTYTYPSTRKALASFAEASEIALVEFREGVLRLGVVVSSKAQGEAVIAHVEATMKHESPLLRCYRPSSPRRIEIQPKGR